MPATPTANGRTEKVSKKQSKIVVIKVPRSILKQFVTTKESPSTASSPAPTVEEPPQVTQAQSQENTSDANSTPNPMQDASMVNGSAKTKGSTSNGTKRSTPMPSDNANKPRGKPGPKKKPRLEDGTIDHSIKPVPTSTANHKLGPKANTGFINANLRALDRSGAPCRKWQRKGFQLKSFTGQHWELPSWKGSENSGLQNGDPFGTGKDASMPGSSDQKPSESDTAAGSNVGDHVDKMDVSTPAASSPPPIHHAATPSLQVQS